MITLVKNFAEVDKIINIYELKTLIQTCVDQPNKKNSLMFCANVKFDRRRTKEAITEYTGIYTFDIDIEKEHLISKNKTILTAEEYNDIQNDLKYLISLYAKDVVLIKKSHSKTGLHILLGGDKAKSEQQFANIYYYMFKMLDDNLHLDYNKGNIKYKYNVDDNATDTTRGLFLNRDEDVILNEENIGLFCGIKFNISKTKTKPQTKDDLNSIVSNNIGNSIKSFEVLKDIISDKYNKDIISLKEWLSTVEINFNATLFFALKNSCENYNRFFFNFFKKEYIARHHDNEGVIKAIKSFDNWKIFISTFKIKKNVKQISITDWLSINKCPIEGLFNLRINNKKDTDIFNLKYDVTLHCTNYLTEIYNDITSEFIDGINVLKAPTGAGKTTLIKKYIQEEYKDKTVMIVASKTNMLDQMYNDLSNCGLNLYRKYSSHKHGVINTKGCVIFTTINSAHLYKTLDIDLFVYDECHLLSTFASLNKNPNSHDYTSNYDFIYNLFNTKIKQIYISATPEQFNLCMVNKVYRYINVIKNTYIKPNLSVNFTGNIINDMAKCYLNTSGATNIVYINDEAKIDILITDTRSCFFGCKKISSKMKKMEYVNDLAIKNIIATGVTYLVTGYMAEALNILNEDLINIYIVDNHTADVFTFNQLANRFRRGNIRCHLFTGKRSYQDDFRSYDFKRMYMKEYEMVKNYVDGVKKDDIEILSNIKVIKGNIVDEMYITNQIYYLFRKLLNKNMPYYMFFLKQYFNILNENWIELDHDAVKDKNLQRNLTTDEKDFFNKYTDLVGEMVYNHLELSKEQIMAHLSDINEYEYVMSMLAENKNMFKRIFMQKMEIGRLGIDDECYFKVSRAFNEDLIYFKHKKIFSSDIAELGGVDIKVKKELENIYGLILNNCEIKKRKGVEYKRIKVSDIKVILGGLKLDYLNMNVNDTRGLNRLCLLFGDKYRNEDGMYILL